MFGKWHLSPSAGADPFADHADNVAAVKEAGFDVVGALYMDNFDASNAFTHNNEYVAAEARKHLRKCAADGVPCFTLVNPTTPHAPSVVEALTSGSSAVGPEGAIPPPDADAGLPTRSAVLSRAVARSL